MAVKFTDHILEAGVHADLPVAGDTPHGALFACTDHDKIYRNNGTTWDDWFIGGAGGGGGGLTVFAPVTFCPLSTGASYTGAADEARMFQLPLTAPMYVRGLGLDVGATGSGTHEWGLFDASAGAGAAVQLVAGSGAIGGTGFQVLAATGAPVLVPAGNYLLIFKWPAANRAQLKYSAGAPAAAVLAKVHTTYTWDTTPDVDSGWTDDIGVFWMVLMGDVDNAGVQW